MRFGHLFVPLLAQTLVATGQLTPVLDDSTETFVNQVLEHWNSSTGIAIAVVRRDAQGAWFIETGGYGRANAEGSKRVTANTRFGIGSNSKLFTGIAAGLLTHDSRVSPPLTWSSKIKDLLPGWGLEDEIASNEATVQDLLSHRTGVPRHDLAVRRGDTGADILRKVKHHRPSASFRDIWQYNNHMHKIAATLAPTLLPSHQSHARYVKENVFDKLGLTSTTYSYDVANSTGEMADGITRDITGEIRTLPYWVPDGGEDGNIQAGDGGIISSAADMAVWIQTLLLNGANPKTNETVIPADVIQKVATGVSVELGAGEFSEIGPLVYGAGQERGSYRGQEFIEHSGVVPGYRTVVSRYPNSNYGIAVLSNDDVVGQTLIRIVQYYLADRIFGLDQVDWDSRYQALYLKSKSSKPTPRPANASFPYGDIKKLEGMYNNDGYDNMELCYASSSNSSVAGGSKSCEALEPASRRSCLVLFSQTSQPSLRRGMLPLYPTSCFSILMVDCSTFQGWEATPLEIPQAHTGYKILMYHTNALAVVGLPGLLNPSSPMLGGTSPPVPSASLTASISASASVTVLPTPDIPIPSSPVPPGLIEQILGLTGQLVSATNIGSITNSATALLDLNGVLSSSLLGCGCADSLGLGGLVNDVEALTAQLVAILGWCEQNGSTVNAGSEPIVVNASDLLNSLGLGDLIQVNGVVDGLGAGISHPVNSILHLLGLGGLKLRR